ncbi:DUF397 domain-containing protein [Kitasatospora sp. NPDC048239]|uniref:DUF397 domain-containing protein n=1 Tax=Kitasatospora sp. NPDC048239 TaxID=3364046 RepID=UPI00371A9E73
MCTRLLASGTAAGNPDLVQEKVSSRPARRRRLFEEDGPLLMAVHSEDPEGPVLVFPAAARQSFIDAVQADHLPAAELPGPVAAPQRPA